MQPYSELLSFQASAVRDALMKVIDPEIGENIVDLGLVYGIETSESSINVIMTMTSPACPMGEMLLNEVHEELVHTFPDLEIDIQLIWDPAWDPEMMSNTAKTNLGWDLNS
ncbi:MAG: metal-sulfur cluster assembly factor [Nitrosomonadales bacterium]|nr:metal-sulfur cluster assembly factor [Nitrosomonadales bacterium]